MAASLQAANKALVRRYLERVQAGDPAAAELLADDVRWWVPQGSSLGGTYEGKPAVLALMARGAGLYDPATPLRISVDALVAEGDRVCALFELRARSAAGAPYCNQYCMVLRVRAGEIAEVREYVDTHYVHETLGI